MNHNNGNRRVQFSFYENSANSTSSSNKSVPNSNPLTSQESMPYRPESTRIRPESIQCSPPYLKNRAKSIEIKQKFPKKMNKVTVNSNNSTPESINEPIPSTNMNPSIPMNASNSYLPNIDHNNLFDHGSHEIENNDDNDKKQDGIDQFDTTLLPITQFTNNKVYNIKTQREHTVSNASYDHIPNLYAENSNSKPPPFPDAASIALSDDSPKNVKKSTLSLNKHFSNDTKAFETWMACCDIQDDTFGIICTVYSIHQNK